MRRNWLKKIAFVLVKKYRHSTLPQTLVLIIDILLFVLAFFIVEAIRNDGIENVFSRINFVKFGSLLMLTALIFLITGSFRGIIRHAGMEDIHKIMIANLSLFSLTWLTNFINNQFSPKIIPSEYLMSYGEFAQGEVMAFPEIDVCVMDEPITTGVCISKQGRLTDGVWNQEFTYEIPITKPILGFTNNLIVKQSSFY